jgi:hypothetical protein
MAAFTFDDGTGSQTLSCSYQAPANRFRDWTPVPKYIGERAIALGDGRRYQYQHRTSQAASGRLPGIPVSAESTMRAFILWAEGGGLFTCTTHDAESNEYADCQLASDRDGEPIDLEISFDPVQMEYTLGFTIEHVGDPQEVLRAVYFAQPGTVMLGAAAAFTIAGMDAQFATPLMDGDDAAFTITGIAATFTVT